jgi:EmrB/QacA subfamily drug resistance transporter
MRIIVLIVTTVAAFLAPFMSSSVNIALPSIGKEFSMSAVVLSWVATSYLLAAAVCLVPFGKLADIRGRRRIFGWGSLVFALSSFFCALSPSALFLVVLRVVQGIGSAMTFSTGVAILTSVFPLGERGRVLGINVSATYIGLSFGPVLGGVLTEHLGWRSIFWLNGGMGLFLAVLVFFLLKGEWAEAGGESFDAVGAALLGLALIAIMAALTSLGGSVLGGVLLAAGILGGVFFVRRESRIQNPVLDMTLFRTNAVFAFSNLAALINYSATFAVGFLLSLYLQYIKGLGPEKAGLIMVAQPAVMALFSPGAGRLSDRIEPRILASAGMAVSAVGLLLLSFLRLPTTLVFIGASLVVLGFGFALFSSPNTNAVMSSVEKRYYGVASAVLSTMRITGQTLSMAVAGLIVAFYLGTSAIVPPLYPRFLTGLRTAFLFFGLLCFAGVFASLKRGHLRPRAGGGTGEGSL